MADDVFVKKLRLELEGVQQAADNIQRTGEGFEELAKKVANAIVASDKLGDAISKGATQGVSATRQMSDAMQQLEKDAAKTQEALQKAMEADIAKGGMGRPEDAVRTLSAEQIEKAIQWANVQTGQVVPAAKATTKEIAQMAAAWTADANAMSKMEFEKTISGLSRLEQAQARAARAQKELQDASTNLESARAAGDNEAVAKALNDRARAAGAATQANARLVAEQDKVTAAQERTNKALQDASAKRGKAEADRNFDNEIRGYTELGQAAARHAKAVREEEQARIQLAAARKSGDKEKEIQAENHLAQAISKTAQARARMESTTQRQKDSRLKEEAKEAEELTKSVERLANARRTAQEAIPQSGQSRIETAYNNEKRALEELSRARWDYMQLLSSGTASSEQLAKAHNAVATAQNNATRAQKQHNQEAERAINTLPRLRYALYDVSRTLRQLGTVLTGASTAVGVVATKMNRDFADVIRTTEAFRDSTGQTAASMQRDFEALYSSMPADWADITRIGEMAGQMNIAADDVARFTGLVTKFAASTDVSVDSAATAFGRLSVLLNVSAAEYENLGSSILKTGVNSVATENQIINISQQIAGIAGTAGFAADEVVGLSAAFASIGTAPELTRGIVTRFFTNLMTAVSDGGARLEKFAIVANMSAAEFRQAWEQDAAGAFRAVIEGLGKVEESDAVGVLRELGIQQVRDIPAVLKLAQNYDLLAHTMGVAADGYREGSALNEHYGVIVDTMASKLTILKNQFALFASTAGEFTQSDIFKGMIDGLTRLLSLATSFANHPLGKHLTTFGVIVSGLVGGLSLLAAGILGVVAASQGMRTAFVNLATSMNTTVSITKLNDMSLKQLLGTIIATDRGAKALRVSLGAIGIGLAFTAGAYAIAKMGEDAQRTTEAVDRMKGVLSGIGDAIREDTADWQAAVADENEKLAQSFREIPLSTDEAAEGVTRVSDSFYEITGLSKQVSSGLDEVADSAEQASIAIGKKTTAALLDAILMDEKFIEMLKKSADALHETGFSLDEYLAAMAKGPEAVDAYLADMKAALDSAQAIVNSQAQGSISSPVFDEAREKVKVLGAAYAELKAVSDGFNESLSTTQIKTAVTNAIMAQFGDDSEDVAEQLAALNDEVEGFRSLLTDFDSSAWSMQDTLYGLTDALIKNGESFDMFSVEGRANMKALESAMDDLWDAADGDAHVFAENIANAFAYVEGAGFDLTQSIDVLDQVLDATFGTEWRAHLDTSAAHQGVAAYIAAVEAALRARAELERDAANKAMAVARATPSLQGAIAYSNLAAQHEANAKSIDKQITAVQSLGKNLGDAAKQGNNAGRALRDLASGGGRGGGGGPKKAAKDAKGLKEELYTLKNYASDLAEIWSRAFEIRFSGQQTIDSVTKSLRGIADRFEDAEQKVRDLRLQLQALEGDLTGMQAELSKQQYHLSIATEYGDTARAEQLTASIAKLQADLAAKQAEVAKTSKELGKAQAATSRDLEGTSDAAIQNRSDLIGLVKQYQDHIKALAESGMGQKDLQKETEKLRKDFVAQASQLGFNRTELKKYEVAFQDVKRAIDTVPRNITVNANMNPAEQAVNEWIAKANKKKATVNANVSMPKSLGSIGGGQFRPSSVFSNGSLSVSKVTAREGSTVRIVGGGPGKGIMQMIATGGLVDALKPLYRASGGPAEWAKMYAKGTDTIPAMLTPGEYVVQKKAVDFYGPEVMQAINRMKVPKQFFTASGAPERGVQGLSAHGGRVTVDLSPSSVQAVAHAVQPYLVVDGKVIQQANGAANRRASNVGAN